MCLVFATCLGFRFAPRIRDLADRRLYVPDKAKLLPESSDVYRRHHQVETDPCLVAGDPAARFFNRKLASYPRQNGLTVALRECFDRDKSALFW
jgi:TnpA family transposase